MVEPYDSPNPMSWGPNNYFQPMGSGTGGPYSEIFAQLAQNSTRYRLFRSYYYGRHRLAFATEKFRNTFGRMFREFADNLCPTVVDALADRLQVTGFDSQNKDIIEEIWKDNDLDLRSGQMHTEALKLGDAYMMVWPDPITGEPKFYPQRSENMVVFYDEEDPENICMAAKLWRKMDCKQFRLNLYFPDRIEKYISVENLEPGSIAMDKFIKYQDEGDPSWPIQNPYGRVPIFHFANNTSFGEPGQSELRDIIPIQDALNKAVTDMMVAMEFVALPQRYATGIQIDIDENTGRPSDQNFMPGIDRIWATRSENAKFGEFSQADLRQFIEVQDSFRAEMARVSGTPFHYMMLTGGKLVSGDALEASEARFIAKIRDRQSVFGEVWEEMMEFALTIKGVAEEEIETLWSSAAPKSETDMWTTNLQKQQVGLSLEQILRESGYTEDQIADIIEEKKASDKAKATMGNQLVDAFNSGMTQDSMDYMDNEGSDGDMTPMKGKGSKKGMK